MLKYLLYIMFLLKTYLKILIYSRTDMFLVGKTGSKPHTISNETFGSIRTASLVDLSVKQCEYLEKNGRHIQTLLFL